MRLKLKAGDIVLVRTRSWLARVIFWATRDADEEDTVVNHSAGAVHSDFWDRVLIVEALGDGVKVRPFISAYGDGQAKVAIFRPINLEPGQRARIARYLLDNVGKKYGYLKLLVHLGRKWSFGRKIIDKIFPRVALDDYPICSYLIAKAYESVGLDFGVHASLATPDDIWDFCLANPDKYKPILYPARKLHL